MFLFGLKYILFENENLSENNQQQQKTGKINLP